MYSRRNEIIIALDLKIRPIGQNDKSSHHLCIGLDCYKCKMFAIPRCFGIRNIICSKTRLIDNVE